jgi:hypothetical protein
MLGVIVFTLALGGLVCLEKALAGPGDPCATPSSTNYKNCTDCDCKVLAVVPGNKVTVTTAQAVLKCSKDSRCNKPTGSLWNAKYDLNNDLVVNSIDVQIATKCSGCCSTPSPFK